MAALLLIDDSPEVQRLFQVAFKTKLGYEIVIAANGEAGIEAALRSSFDVIVLDVMMPGMDGYTVARQMRQNPKTKDVPIIMFTARAQPTDKTAALEAGADAILSKLASFDEIMAAIKEVTKSKSAATAASGQVIGVLGCRGGVGATTLAVNVAASYIRRGQRACLLDLAPLSGHAALVLRMSPKPSWDDLSGEINTETIQPLLRQHASGVHLLAAPPQPPSFEMSNHSFNRLSQTLASAFNVVVINCSPSLDATSRAAVAAASRLLLVTSPEVTAVQAAKGIMSYLHSLSLPAERLRVVVNHAAKDMTLPSANIVMALGRTIDAELPYDESQANALLQGMPLVFLAKSAPLPPYVLGLASLLQKM